MAWGCMQLPKGLKATQTLKQKVQPIRRSGIGSLLVRRQLLIYLLQYSVRKVSKP